jgi:hypothetical protein
MPPGPQLRELLRISVPVLALFGFACSGNRPAEPPEPRELIVSASPAQVFALADTLLIRAGWVTTLKEHESTLRAEHKARGEDNGEWMTCESGVGRTGDRRRATRDLRSTVAVQVEARPDPAGTRTRIMAGAQAYSLFPQDGPAIGNYAVSHCTSSGRMESLLADSIAARFATVVPKVVQ